MKRCCGGLVNVLMIYFLGNASSEGTLEFSDSYSDWFGQIFKRKMMHQRLLTLKRSRDYQPAKISERDSSNQQG